MKNDKTDNHEQLFWEEIDRLFPDMIKAITSLSKKSYLSITNLRTGITWWSERAMDYFGMKENYTIRGMEALIRWELEPYGLISPGIFMEWLEEDPCIFDLGNWILRTALKDIGRIRDKIPHFFVNVNISAAQLSRKEFRDSVMTILKETGARPEELCLELTERCRDLDVTFLKNEVNFFHSKGIKIALDDFGTGNSSLSLALELPIDELKVDMSFIKDIEHKPQNQAMVQSIVDYANRTNTETCIEGIENQEVSDYVHQFGATWYQGYFYSKPVPIDQFETLLDVPH